MSIKIYPQEIADGLEKAISNASIAMLLPIETDDNTDVKLDTQIIHNATGSDNFDLFPMKSILASTGKNKNDDIFDKCELWKARESCKDKPLNIEHDQHEIIGHMVDGLAVSTDLLPLNYAIDASVDEMGWFNILPDQFHILAKSVIYKYWSDSEYQDKINTILDEIQMGKWFVSMECLFSNFDYGVCGPDGTNKIVKRDESSAFLTKHLRVYGGTGVYNGYQIGRVLRNITFSGKGLVKRPANPYSVILNNYETFSAADANVVYITSNAEFSIQTENDKMHEDKIAELEKLVANLTKENSNLQTKISEVTKTQADGLKAELDSVKASNVELANKINDLEVQLKAQSEVNTKLADENKKLNLEVVKSSRIAKVVKAGKTQEEAELLVEGFASVTDEIFDAVVLLASAVNVSSPNETPIVPVNHLPNPKAYVEKMISKTSKSNAPQKMISQAAEASEVIDAAEPVADQTPATDVEPTKTKVENTRAAIASYLDSFLSKK